MQFHAQALAVDESNQPPAVEPGCSVSSVRFVRESDVFLKALALHQCSAGLLFGVFIQPGKLRSTTVP